MPSAFGSEGTVLTSIKDKNLLNKKSCGVYVTSFSNKLQDQPNPTHESINKTLHTINLVLQITKGLRETRCI